MAEDWVMIQYQQLEFHSEPIEITLLREVKLLREQSEKVRKGQFAKIGKLQKMYDELKRDHEDFKAAICKGKFD